MPHLGVAALAVVLACVLARTAAVVPLENHRTGAVWVEVGASSHPDPHTLPAYPRHSNSPLVTPVLTRPHPGHSAHVCVGGIERICCCGDYATCKVAPGVVVP
jgi:hypothetical protein